MQMQFLMEQVADNQNAVTGGNLSENNRDNDSKEQIEPGEAEGIIDGDIDGIDGDKEEVEGYIWESM